MEKNGSLKNNKFIINTFFYLILIGTLVFFLNRVRYTISLFDEVSNIALGYRVSIGQLPLVDIWEFQQTGSIFLVPFINLYIKLNHSTDGIILYLRLVYFAINIMICILIYLIFKKTINKKILLLISMCIITYAPFSLYYLWYDTAGVIFMLVGSIFLYQAMDDNTRLMKISCILAGCFHACMAYAYPSFILIIPVYVFIILFENDKWKKIFYYACGGLIVFLFFLIYIYIHSNDLFFLNEEIIRNNTLGRSFKFFKRIYDNIWGSFYFLQSATIPTLFLIYLYCKGLIYKKIRILVILGILIVPFYTVRNTGSLAIFLFWFYLFLWFIPISKYLSNLNNKLIIKRLTKYLWLPSIASFFLVGFTANGGGVKSTFGVYNGSIAFIILIGLLIQELIFNYNDDSTFVKRYILTLPLFAVTFFNINLYYKTGFESQSYQESNYKITEGIFNGLYSKTEHKYYVELEKFVKENISPGDESIFFADGLQCGYLFTDLLPYTPHIWDNYIGENEQTNEWNNLEIYFNKKGKPDLIICRSDYLYHKPIKFLNLINENYVLRNKNEQIFIFCLNK